MGCPISDRTGVNARVADILPEHGLIRFEAQVTALKKLQYKRAQGDSLKYLFSVEFFFGVMSFQGSNPLLDYQKVASFGLLLVLAFNRLRPHVQRDRYIGGSARRTCPFILRRPSTLAHCQCRILRGSRVRSSVSALLPQLF